MKITLKSVATICARGGLFSSKKQANFFNTSSDVEGMLVLVESYSFGDHNGCKRFVTYNVYFNDKGITLVSKEAKKAETLFSADVNVFLDSKQAKLDWINSCHEEDIKLLAIKKDELFNVYKLPSVLGV